MRRKLAEMVADSRAAMVRRRTTASPDACRNVSCRSPLKTCRLDHRISMRSRSTAAMATSRPGRCPLRCDAQVNTIWEGPDNLCLDVAGSSRRALTRHCYALCDAVSKSRR